MAVVAKASIPASLAPFELKSASLSAVALVLRTSDTLALSASMAALYGETPGVFDHDPVIIDLSQLAADAPALDFEALTALLRSHRMLPAAVRGATPEQAQAALAAGLGEAPDHAPAPPAAALVAAASADGATLAAAPAPEPGLEAEADADADADPEEIAPAAPPARVATLVVDKPLRSGQQVYAKGGDLVVLAAVNFGAEVIADGNIHVYGPLRGKAVAGAKGNRDARIFSTCMEAELLAIAGTYRTTENPLPGTVLGKAAQIRLDGDRLVFEALA